MAMNSSSSLVMGHVAAASCLAFELLIQENVAFDVDVIVKDNNVMMKKKIVQATGSHHCSQFINPCSFNLPTLLSFAGNKCKVSFEKLSKTSSSGGDVMLNRHSVTSCKDFCTSMKTCFAFDFYADHVPEKR